MLVDQTNCVPGSSNVDIPDWIPREMSWVNPKPPNVRTLTMLHYLTKIFPIVMGISLVYMIVGYLLHLDTEKIRPLVISGNYVIGMIYLFGKLLNDNGPVSVHLQ